MCYWWVQLAQVLLLFNQSWYWRRYLLSYICSSYYFLDKHFCKFTVMLISIFDLTGKTLLAKTLARIVNVPCVLADATSLTQAGLIVGTPPSKNSPSFSLRKKFSWIYICFWEVLLLWYPYTHFYVLLLFFFFSLMNSVDRWLYDEWFKYMLHLWGYGGKEWSLVKLHVL